MKLKVVKAFVMTVIEASIPIIANATPEDKSLNVYFNSN